MKLRARAKSSWLPRSVLAVSAAICLAGPVLAEPRLALPPVVVAPSDAPQRAAELSAALASALRSPGRFEVTLVAEANTDGASASQVRGWALDTGADAVVAARLESDQLWIELRSAHSGGLLGGWAIDPQLEPAAVRPVLAGIREALGAASLDGAVGAPSESDGNAQAEPLLGSLRSDGPISIKSDQLDVVSSGGERHLVFTRNVRVQQGDIELRSEKLEAFYDAGESRPEKLIAVGGVHVVQGDRVARCDRATYQRAEQRIVCAGRASLVQGCDVVRGGRIEFDLEYEHFTVMGAASVVIAPDDQECAAEGRS
jgi:lipopolysaccharide export system protein LptA